MALAHTNVTRALLWKIEGASADILHAAGGEYDDEMRQGRRAAPFMRASQPASSTSGCGSLMKSASS